MDELRESSLLFSLESLLETERERVQREAREAQRRREDELRRVAEVGERRRLAAQQEREAQERRRQLDEERERLETAQLEALQRATVERARFEAEGQLRLVEAEQARQHDQMLARIREGERSARYRTLSWLSAGALAAVTAGFLGAYFGLLRPAQARDLQHQQALVSAAEQRTAAKGLELGAERRRAERLSERVKELEGKVKGLEEAASRGAAQLGGLKPATPNRPGTGKPVLGGTQTSRGTKVCPDDGDPLRGCLK